MSFFGRALSYVFNELLVNTLANSKTFQRFAIGTTHKLEELTKKGVEKQGEIGSRAAEFSKTFREELRKGMDDLTQHQQQHQQPPKK